MLAMLVSSCHSSKKVTEKQSKNNEYVNSSGDNGYLGFELNKNDNKKLYEEVSKWIGTPYRYGGNTRKGTDCSGMVMEIYKIVYNKKLERNSASIMEKNCKEISKKKLKEGDLVFFATGRNKNRISHVGLYLKDNKFVHSSSSRGVIISSLDENYYIRNYVCSGRVE